MKNQFARKNHIAFLAITLLAGCVAENLPEANDEAGDGKGDKGTTRGSDDHPAAKRVFVTSDPNGWSGNLMAAGGGTDGLDGADRLCASAASAASLDGTWVAWLSTGSVNASDRIGTAPRILVDGTPVMSGAVVISASDHRQTFVLDHPIDLDAAGQRTVTAVWSGSLDSGRGDNTACADWTTSESLDYGLFGFSDQVSSQWTNVFAMKCFNTANLYCFEQ